jgi:hypothetical protein
MRIKVGSLIESPNAAYGKCLLVTKSTKTTVDAIGPTGIAVQIEPDDIVLMGQLTVGSSYQNGNGPRFRRYQVISTNGDIIHRGDLPVSDKNGEETRISVIRQWAFEEMTTSSNF